MQNLPSYWHEINNWNKKKKKKEKKKKINEMENLKIYVPFEFNIKLNQPTLK